MIQFGNLSYKIIESENLTFEIINPKNPNLPETLYRYFPISERAIDVLKRCRFYVTQPDEFNDLWDGSFLLLDFENITKEEVKKFLKETLSDEEIEATWETDRKSLINKVWVNYYGILFSKCGVVCMSDTLKNELLWSYYNNHEGFSVEYDYKSFPKNFRGPFPVNYQSNLSRINISKHGGIISFLIHCTLKKDIWAHENEYRFIVNTKDKDFKVTGFFSNEHIDLPYKERFEDYPQKSIKSITLGFRFLKNEKFQSIGNDQYLVNFISEKWKLKSDLFDFIIDNNINCQSTNLELADFSVKIEKWNILKNNGGGFTVKRTLIEQ